MRRPHYPWVMRIVSEVSVDTTLADARESYAYWRSRRAQLPWHRRAARREARTLAARWRARLVRAHLDRLGLDATAIVVAPLIGVLARTRGDHARWLWRTFGRRAPLARRLLCLAVAVTGLAITTLAVLVIVAAHMLLF